ncbi:hypothetical protein ACQJBY_056905 [Aegilops geniculata]
MAPVNGRNTRRSMAISFLVLIMISASTLPSCHARVSEATCEDLQQGCSVPDCMDLCNKKHLGSHFSYCNNIGQCCCKHT